MRKFLILFIWLLSFEAMAEFVHPMDFDGSEAQKSEVIKYIEQKVRKDYCDSGLDMCNATVLRRMERANLEAFKEAINAENRKIMDRVIKDYCNSGLDMCNYKVILRMYKKNLEASGQSLTW